MIGIVFNVLLCGSKSGYCFRGGDGWGGACTVPGTRRDPGVGETKCKWIDWGQFGVTKGVENRIKSVSPLPASVSARNCIMYVKWPPCAKAPTRKCHRAQIKHTHTYNPSKIIQDRSNYNYSYDLSISEGFLTLSGPLCLERVVFCSLTPHIRSLCILNCSIMRC